MPSITQYAKIFRDWEGLIGAADNRAALLPGIEAFKATLTGLLTQTKALKLKQEGFAGDKKATTEQLRSVVRDGRDAAGKLRAFVKSQIGVRTEILTEFGITPARSRKRSVKPPEVPPPAAGETPAAAVEDEAPRNPATTVK